MDEFKTKFAGLLNKQTKIPPMGFSDYIAQIISESNDRNNQNVIDNSGTTLAMDEISTTSYSQKSDREILESIQDAYYRTDSDMTMYELQTVLLRGVNFSSINEKIFQLRRQHKVLSKQVLQSILHQQNVCNVEFSVINAIQKDLEESLWTCRKVRSYVKYAKNNLTTTSLQILASYQKREILRHLLETMLSIKHMKSTDMEMQKLLRNCNYSGAISLLLQCKDSATSYMQFCCVRSLYKNLQETLILTEFQLDVVLNEMVFNFDFRKYLNLQEAYKLLNKSLIAMDQLHINFISAIHSSANTVIRSYSNKRNNENIKYLYEQLCEQISAENYIPCLISFCKVMWTILSSYHQIIMWHRNHNMYPPELHDSPDIFIQEKLKKGQSRIWNDMLTKICLFLQSSTFETLKYDQFIQVLSIVQILKKVGIEFCCEPSEKLTDTLQEQSQYFLKRYHVSFLEEICLFLDHESWTGIDSFESILLLPEFRSVRHLLVRQQSEPNDVLVSTSYAYKSSPQIVANDNNCNKLTSVDSQDVTSSIYGTYNYFLRFSEKNSPFDGSLDIFMLEEDIISEIVDETSCYFSERIEEAQKEIQSKYDTANKQTFVNNTTLNIFRCIGRYLQMAKLLPCISEKIMGNIFELMDFYIYAIIEIFGKDSPLDQEKFYTTRLVRKLQVVQAKTINLITIWPLNLSSLINNELANPDSLYGLKHRIIAVESGRYMMQEFQVMLNYIMHFLPLKDHQMLTAFLSDINCMEDISLVLYSCVTARVIDLQTVYSMMGKVKWDVNHVSLQHSNYIDVMNRNIQNFTMRLEEISKETFVPTKQMWNSMAHISSYIFVEGFSNVKKCSAGGRALMQLDFTNFMSILELISNHKFPDHRAHVDSFIKAYYFSNQQFEEWIQQHSNLQQYSTKQLTNLIHCVCVSDKRMRQNLLHFVCSNDSTTNLNRTSDL